MWNKKNKQLNVYKLKIVPMQKFQIISCLQKSFDHSLQKYARYLRIDLIMEKIKCFQKSPKASFCRELKYSQMSFFQTIFWHQKTIQGSTLYCKNYSYQCI